jgi:DNA-directed RNA polymerase subunit RPC12/RpoP
VIDFEMSDEARDLLIYGEAAARANSPDEARNYLEWVLRTDADLDQQAEAWYWLSTIAPTPVEKRSCLESALAAVPSYPEARRDLAILDGRVKFEQPPDPWKEVAPLIPGPSLGTGELVRYKCPQCGAAITAAPSTGLLSCSFCGYRAGASKTATGDAQALSLRVGEQDWDAAMFSARGHLWELPTARSFVCHSCGASVVVPPGQANTLCPFCGTPHTIHSATEQELIEPTGVLRFALTRAQASAAIMTWLRSEHFAPDNLSDRAAQSIPHAVYLPVWTFDISGEISWSGYLPKAEYRTVTTVPVSGTIPILADDVLVPATRSLSVELIEQLRFDLHQLVPYSSDILAGWPTEIYAISPAAASIEARSRVLDDTSPRKLVTGSADTTLVEDLAVDSSDLSVLSYKLVLLPVWIGSYTYEGQVYQVVVNGHNGIVEGNVPRSLIQKVLNHLLG